MMEALRQLKIPVLFGCGIFNILLALFLLVIHFQSFKKKCTLIKLELCTAVYVIGDSLSFFYDGNPSQIGIIVSRLTGCILFLSLIFTIIFLCDYVTALFMETGKFQKLPRRLLAVYVISYVGLSFVIISQFTNLYYWFDELNFYHRGPLYWLGFSIPFMNILLLFSFVVQHRKKIKKRLLWAICVFCILPIMGAALQLKLYGLPLIDLTSWTASVILFLLALSEQNDELEKAATTELATGLPNSYGFLYEIEKLSHQKDITEYNGFYFDIIRMKTINTKYGKKIADDILVEYAHTIRKSIDKDEVLGRLGGNYFVALIKKVNTEKFLQLLQAVPVKVDHNGNTEIIHIGAVAGGYEIKRKRKFVTSQLIGKTSAAISYAKNVAHKNVVFLDDELENELNRIGVIEEQAKKGILNNEFEAFYQPKVDSRGKVLCGAEALVRWKKDGRIIPPFEFIQIMENNYSICDLDFYVLENVCKDIKGWIEQGIEPVRISVNFSRKNLGNPILAEAIAKIVEKYDIPKDLIQIEVTETIDEYPMSYLIGVVEALQRYGFTVAIDDFGTGSSSIKLLKEVKFDVLKIDKTFIDYNTNSEKRLLQNIIQMAQDIGLSVLAEGVEDRTKLEELKEMNCYVIQGYVFDKPLEKAEFEKRLKRVHSNY